MHIQGLEQSLCALIQRGYLCDSYFTYTVIMKIKGLGLDEAMKVHSWSKFRPEVFFFLMNKVHGSLTLNNFVPSWGRKKKGCKKPKCTKYMCDGRFSFFFFFFPIG